ncbi:MAG: hypothetical protein P0Y49_09220 [Candidatus Pedobacter colombiensis]|uniref:Uncharacterized protein n=1 Tax=Candidatus Pedobacter colombiensis TaxID=3121371 RepID=A0AAJ5WBM0_9SPHI|nr:hypothetical protein [Pedobacter sp.]WEK21320.1 MAG: hypothetical protein P0Y49_09220 [Pedobacter sp.]
MTNKNLQLVFDTLLCMPGMNEKVKIDLRPSRKLVLLLSQVVERGLTVKDGDGIVEAVPEAAINELKELVEGCMEKSGLTEFGQKLKNIQQFKG